LKSSEEQVTTHDAAPSIKTDSDVLADAAATAVVAPAEATLVAETASEITDSNPHNAMQ
jgi:hypothetical protein